MGRSPIVLLQCCYVCHAVRGAPSHDKPYGAHWLWMHFELGVLVSSLVVGIPTDILAIASGRLPLVIPWRVRSTDVGMQEQYVLLLTFSSPLKRPLSYRRLIFSFISCRSRDMRALEFSRQTNKFMSCSSHQEHSEKYRFSCLLWLYKSIEMEHQNNK